MLLREVALPRVGRVILPLPKGTQLLGVGASRREEAPALLVLAKQSEPEIEPRTFIVLSTAQASAARDMQDIDKPEARFVGISGGETASWAVFEFSEVTDRADVASAVLAESVSG